jgi:hypothetical protein
MNTKWTKLLDIAKKRFNINGEYFKKYDMYVLFWNDFVVGKFQRQIFNTISNDQILKQAERLIFRIKYLYSKDAKESRLLKK